MHRITTALLAVFAVFAFIAAGTPAVQAQQVRAEGGATAAGGPAQAPKYRKCFDGRCTITISRPVSFKISKRFGYTKLSVSRTGRLVKVRASGPGISGQVTIGKGARGTLNNLSVRVLSISTKKATVRFAPTR